MEPLHLGGEFDLTLDDKSRLMVPAPLRKRINPLVHGESFQLGIPREGVLSLYPKLYFEWLRNKGPVDELAEDASRDFDRIAYGLGGPVDMDKAGRVVIPEKTRNRVGLGRDVTVIGVRDHIEVWNRSSWEAYVTDLLARRASIEQAVRQGRRTANDAQPGA